MRVRFTQQFTSTASREALDREILQRRLILALYTLGTGLKRISSGEHEESYRDLLHIRREYIRKEQLCNAIAAIANEVFRIRDFVMLDMG